MNQFDRTLLLIGEDGLERLKNSRVAIIGLGGVGSYAAEAIVRSGVGSIQIWDKDIVEITNINRQLPAMHSTLNKPKALVLEERYLDINPNVNLQAMVRVFNENEVKNLLDFKPDFVIDCIDSVKDKIELIDNCIKNSVPLISVMGTGNKLNPEKLSVGDIHKTHTDPLARIIRKEAVKRSWKRLPVVWSDENPKRNLNGGPVGSISFVPSVAGLLAAGYVVNSLL